MSMEHLKLLSPNPDIRASYRCDCCKHDCINFSKCVNGSGNTYHPHITYDPKL